MANHFARAKMMMAAIQAIVTTTPSPLEAQVKINNLAPYRSRGHGRAKNSGLTVAKAHRATYLKLRGRQYEVTQGKREIARRLARGLDGQCGVLHG